jgi:hypothetical protein
MKSTDASGRDRLSTPIGGHGCVTGRDAPADLIADSRLAFGVPANVKPE